VAAQPFHDRHPLAGGVAPQVRRGISGKRPAAAAHPLIEQHNPLVYWEMCGNPGGRPGWCMAGRGSGCTAGQRRRFDAARYRFWSPASSMPL